MLYIGLKVVLVSVSANDCVRLRACMLNIMIADVVVECETGACSQQS